MPIDGKLTFNPALTASNPSTVHYDKIFRLFADPLTQCLRDRQANNLARIVSANPNGIRLSELDQVIRVCDLALEAINRDQHALQVFTPNLCGLVQLLSKGFLTQRGTDYHLYRDSLIAYIRWLWKASSFDAEQGTCRQLNICAIEALRRYLNIDKVWQYPMPERFCQTLPVECRRWKPMQDFAQSNIIEGLVKSVLAAGSNDPIQPLRAMLLRDLSMAPATAELILSEDCHVVPAMRMLLQTNRREMMVPLAIETIWNLFEQCKDLAAVRLGQGFIVQSLSMILVGTLQPGSSLEDRCLRNQIMCLFTFLTRVPDIGQAFIEAGIIDCLLKHSIELEMGVVHSTSFQFEDVEMKKLLWAVIADLASDPDCVAIYATSPLVSALLVHTDIESGPDSLQILIDVDRHALALASFQLLSVLLPKLHSIFQLQDGMRRMSRYLRISRDRIAEIDRVAISVLLKGCQTQEDCQAVIEDICEIFIDTSRLPQVRSDLAVLLARCSSMAVNVPQILRRTGALAAAINSIADIKSSVKLVASSLHIVKRGCMDDEGNLSFFLQRKGVESVMQLLLSSPSKELQRTSMIFLDDLALSSAGILRQLVESRSETDSRNNLMVSLLNVWKTECNTIKSGCIHGETVSCYGQCQLLSNEKDQSIISQQQSSTLSTLSRIIQRMSQLIPVTSPEDVFEVAMITMYDDIRICNGWAECLRRYGPKEGENEQFLEFDLIPIRNRIQSMAGSIQMRISQAKSDAHQARQVQEVKFDMFADMIRVLIDQRNHPPEQKIMVGASALVASSRLRLSKEQKKDMCAVALQRDQTMKQILHDTKILSVSESDIVSIDDKCHEAVDCQAEKHPDYIEDVVLGDPVLCQIWSVLQTIQPETSHDFIS